jgi:phage repressor protein C with HTH and peptisase S24 domain
VTRFQLVFRTDNGDHVEMRDNSPNGEIRVGSVVLIDGSIFAARGGHWVARREDVDGMVRFVCTPSVAPDD